MATFLTAVACWTTAQAVGPVCGRVYPERQDDLCWENECVGFRAYGPGTQARGERMFGYDLFLKRSTADPIIERLITGHNAPQAWARIDSLRRAGQDARADSLFESISYHVDHGVGMDCYAVGATLGAGVTAMVDSMGRILYPWCYRQVEIIENGPKRFQARLTFDPVVYDGDTIIEQRVITLDSGSNLNHTSVSYQGLTKPVRIATGIALHDDGPANRLGRGASSPRLHNDGPATIDPQGHYMAYVDPTQGPDNGHLFIGAVFPDQAQSIEVVEQDGVRHLLAYNTSTPGASYDYYWGYGWDRGNVSTYDGWIDILRRCYGQSQVCQPYTVTDEGAWCWFADPRAMRYQSPERGIDMTCIGYIDTHGNIKAMQYDHAHGEQTQALVRSYFQPDDHDNPTFLVLPDGRIMVFYSRHTDEPCFYYRISRQPGDITTLGDEHTIAVEHNTTYPSPFILTDDPDHIYLCWRGINWHPTVARLSMPDDNDRLTVEDGPYQIVQSTGARPYAKYISDDKNRIWMAYTIGHPDNEAPNYLYCNYIDIHDLTLRDITDRKCADIYQAPLRIDKSPDFVDANRAMVVDASPYRDWVWQVALDRDSQPVIAMTRISQDKRSHNYYVARWAGDTWRKHLVAHGGAHFHQSPDIEHCYSGGMAIDPCNTASVYCSVPVNGANGKVYEIVNYVLDDCGEIVSAKAVTANSDANNIRPYVIPTSVDAPLRLLWMHGDYYDWIVSRERPQGFCTGIQGLVTKDFTLRPAPAGGASSPRHVDITHVWNGSDIVLEIDGLSLRYTVDPVTLKPQVVRQGVDWEGGASSPRTASVRQGEYNGCKYQSTNPLANSDSWRSAPRATDGKWHEPTALPSPEIRFVYSDGLLRTYINGLLDQTIILK